MKSEGVRAVVAALVVGGLIVSVAFFTRRRKPVPPSVVSRVQLASGEVVETDPVESARLGALTSEEFEAEMDALRKTLNSPPPQPAPVVASETSPVRSQPASEGGFFAAIGRASEMILPTKTDSSPQAILRPARPITRTPPPQSRASIPSADPDFDNKFTREYDPIIADAAATAGIPAGVLRQTLIAESSLRPDAVSPVGAQGIAQFLPSTFADWNDDPTATPFDPVPAIRASANYLRWLRDRTGDWTGALASYNWGIGNYERRAKTGRPPPGEVVGYAEKILGRAGVL